MSDDVKPVVPEVPPVVAAVVPAVVPEVKPEPKVDHKPEGWDGMSKADMLAALNAERDAKLSANAESKARRLKLAEYETKLAKYDEAEKLVQEENLQATELLKKRDTEIAAMKAKYTALEASVSRDRVVSKVTETLLAKQFSPKIVKVAIAAAKDLSEDTADEFIKEFAKEWKDTLPQPKPEPKSVNPWALAQPPADVSPEGTPGRTPSEKQFNSLFPAKAGKK